MPRYNIKVYCPLSNGKIELIPVVSAFDDNNKELFFPPNICDNGFGGKICTQCISYVWHYLIDGNEINSDRPLSPSIHQGE